MYGVQVKRPSPSVTWEQFVWGLGRGCVQRRAGEGTALNNRVAASKAGTTAGWHGICQKVCVCLYVHAHACTRVCVCVCSSLRKFLSVLCINKVLCTHSVHVYLVLCACSLCAPLYLACKHYIQYMVLFCVSVCIWMLTIRPSLGGVAPWEGQRCCKR